jgi:hypothetical protein
MPDVEDVETAVRCDYALASAPRTICYIDGSIR